MKANYCCTQNVGNIIISHKKNWLILATIMHSHETIKKDCLLNRKRRTENIIYKYIVSASGHPDKAYLGTAEGDYTQMNKTTLAKYVWVLKQKHNITPTLNRYIVKSVPSYSNITKSCM